MARRWLLALSAPTACISVWAACTGDDPLIGRPTFGVAGFSRFSVGVGAAQASRAALDSLGSVIVVGTNGSNGFVARLFP